MNPLDGAVGLGQSGPAYEGECLQRHARGRAYRGTCVGGDSYRPSHRAMRLLSEGDIGRELCVRPHRAFNGPQKVLGRIYSNPERLKPVTPHKVFSMGRSEPPLLPVDIFGTEVKVGHIVCYSILQNRSAALKVAVVAHPPKINKNNVWKVRVRPVYTPGGIHTWRRNDSGTEVLHGEDMKKSSIEVASRILVLPYTEKEVRDHAAVRDAIMRLSP